MNDKAQTTEAATDEAPEKAVEPAHAKRLDLAQKIEAFAQECEADIDEAWEAFKAFVSSKHCNAAKAGDTVPEAGKEPAGETSTESQASPSPATSAEPTEANTSPAASTEAPAPEEPAPAATEAAPATDAPATT